MDSLICISHLRWDFVWQRPQHLLSRLARHYRILFVEEPTTEVGTGAPRLELITVPDLPNLKVVRLIQPVEDKRWIGHGDSLTQPSYNQLLTEFLSTEGYLNPLVWLYTPMASDFLTVIPPRLLIYDVMDQLAAFKGAPPALLEREEQLLERADLVFTGGLSLYRAKKPFNPQTYLFPSGVEQDHWSKAASLTGQAKPADLSAIADPIIGYFGVIDERMDLELLGHLAQAHPEWQIVLLGPVLKVAETDLPQASNLHYLGMKTYQELPAYLAFFKVALIPFGLNEATRYLSPTKTLEYLAADRPIVATPVPDVVELYGEVVRVGATPAQFVSQVEEALSETAQTRQERLDRAAQILARSSWDEIARQMNEIIEQRLHEIG